MKLALLSPASALASRVLPVPGGPTSSTPRGADAPSFAYCAGSCMKALTRFSAALASSLPMASAELGLAAAPPAWVRRTAHAGLQLGDEEHRRHQQSHQHQRRQHGMSIRSSARRLAVRGSTSIRTSAKPAVALRSPSRSSTVPAQPMRVAARHHRAGLLAALARVEHQVRLRWWPGPPPPRRRRPAPGGSPRRASGWPASPAAPARTAAPRRSCAHWRHRSPCR